MGFEIGKNWSEMILPKFILVNEINGWMDGWMDELNESMNT